MKRIKQILVIAILVIFAVACTDEDQLINNETKVNNKIEKSDCSPLSSYPEYEQIDITDKGAMDLLVNFNEEMNGKLQMPDMEINEALLAMEMYFNYAVVDKQTNYDTTITYPEQNFEFTVNYDGGSKILGTDLKTAYTTFLNNVINQMDGKYMRFSDLIVSGKTETTITFKIIIPPYLFDVPEKSREMVHFPSCPIVRNIDEVPNVPEGIYIDMADYFVNGQPAVYTDYPLDILHSFCIKALDGFVYGITTDISIVAENYCGWIIDSDPSAFIPPYKQIDNNDMTNSIIPRALYGANTIRQSLANNLTLLDITTKIQFNNSIGGIKNVNMWSAPFRISSFKKGNVIPGIELRFIDDIIFVP